MNYQGGITVVSGATTTVAGVALLPNTAGSTTLMTVAIASIVTGAMAVLLQIAVSIIRTLAK